MRETDGKAAAPAARCKNRLRGIFMVMPRELQQLRGTNHIQLPTVCLPLAINKCPLLGVMRTLHLTGAMSAFDPKRTCDQFQLDLASSSILKPVGVYTLFWNPAWVTKSAMRAVPSRIDSNLQTSCKLCANLQGGIRWASRSGHRHLKPQWIIG